MPTLVNNPVLEESLIAERRERGIDKFDEVLDGVYVMAPIANNEPDDWTHNYRVPDVLAFLNGNPAQDRGSHWFGGPDFAVEIVSKWDRSREKIDFHAGVGVRELLIIDRDPWQLELFRRTGDQLVSTATATLANALTIESQVVPITLRFVPGDKRPAIAVTSRDGQAWTI
jgi:hypothetical protein